MSTHRLLAAFLPSLFLYFSGHYGTNLKFRERGQLILYFSRDPKRKKREGLDWVEVSRPPTLLTLSIFLWHPEQTACAFNTYYGYCSCLQKTNPFSKQTLLSQCLDSGVLQCKSLLFIRFTYKHFTVQIFNSF